MPRRSEGGSVRQIRIPFIRRARLRPDGGEDEEVFTVDIGIRGVFVERPDPLPVGRGAEIEFCLPGNTIPVRARCRVIWVLGPDAPPRSRPLPPGLGLEFATFAPGDRARVEAHLAHHLAAHPRERRFQRDWPEAIPEDGA
jgi:hypothetical protein